MSKSDISRVKYPKKNEIHDQINAIIEQSHMFEVEQSQSGYVECKRVKKSFFSSNAATAAIAVAACVIMVLCIAPFVGEGIKKSKAHTNVTEYETNTGDVQGTQPVDESNNISFGIANGAKGGGSLYSVMYYYETPIVKVNGGTSYRIAGIYNTKINEQWKELESKYILPQSNASSAEYVYVEFNNALEYVATKNTSILGILSKNILTEGIDGKTPGGHSQKTQRIYVECDTFDSKSGELIEASEFFKDYGTAVDVMAEAVFRQVQEEINAGIQGINEEYKTLTGIRNALKNNSTWRLADNGIVIYCNDYKTYEEPELEFLTNAKISTTTYQTFVITYDKCDIIKDEYKS